MPRKIAGSTAGYRAGEAAGYRLVVTATGRPDVDRAAYLDCRRAGVLVNAADDPDSCSFLAPAVMREGPVSVAVSTGGVSPWLAGWVRGGSAPS
jgi:precorrin-2 dehydrogenase/sirohydrochlorin ferrochelatase